MHLRYIHTFDIYLYKKETHRIFSGTRITRFVVSEWMTQSVCVFESRTGKRSFHKTLHTTDSFLFITVDLCDWITSLLSIFWFRRGMYIWGSGLQEGTPKSGGRKEEERRPPAPETRVILAAAENTHSRDPFVERVEEQVIVSVCIVCIAGAAFRKIRSLVSLTTHNTHANVVSLPDWTHLSLICSSFLNPSPVSTLQSGGEGERLVWCHDSLLSFRSGEKTHSFSICIPPYHSLCGVCYCEIWERVQSKEKTANKRRRSK